ncbi:MAG: PEP-CTERM sorting domain-containing protein [Planctomycetaceae bacterium]|nr:PEP-CTERM sorting domain-containing protein [Planctomycetaceae bacterium]
MICNPLKPSLWIAAICVCLLLNQVSQADTLVYGFDDGTFGDWQLIGVDGEALPQESVTWIPSNETIEFKSPFNGFNLLPATSADYRIIPTPWEKRECLMGVVCHTHILRSPEFLLDSSGDLSIDMMGGCGNGKDSCVSDFDDPPGSPDELPILQTYSNTDLQGYALLDVETNQYVLHAFPSFYNDGIHRPGHPFDAETRNEWETVSISQADLAPYANKDRAYRIDIYDSYRGPSSWIGFDTVTIPGRPVEGGGGISGDVNSDAAVNDADMDELSAAVKEGDSGARFDVNNDGAVNSNDRVFWIESINNSYFGDVNLDGEFNSSDLVSVFSAGKYESGEMAGWAEGDWDGDMTFGSGDLVIAFRSGGYEQGPRPAVAAVPEPSSVVLLLIGFVALLRRR